MADRSGSPAVGRRGALLGIAGGLIAGSGLCRTAHAGLYDDPEELYAALRDQPHSTLSIGGGTIDVAFADGAPGLDRAPVIEWIRKAATAVSTYYGRFPVHHVGLLVIAQDGPKVGSGTTYGFAGSAIRIHAGIGADADAFHNDWVMTHEMVHLALPNVPRKSLWLQEGNATYIEPIARAQAGQLDLESVWRWSVEGMPKGQPKPGDLGLDKTPTWGRTYWGGAAFWLLADIEIYKRTSGRRKLQDALRAINRKSGGNGAEWSVDEIMAAGDAATGTDVLSRLYTEMKAAPVEVDLQNLFEEIGVKEVDGHVTFDDTAPLAKFRQTLTQPVTAG